jgi:hypothetical protein
MARASTVVDLLIGTISVTMRERVMTGRRRTTHRQTNVAGSHG